MGLQGKVWRWAVVLPVTLLALAGGLADVVTGTVNYWYLLAPSYPVIGVAIWRGMSEKAEAARRAKRLAELDRERFEAEAAEAAAAVAAGKPRPHHRTRRPVDIYAGSEAERRAMGDGALVQVERRATVGAAIGDLFGGFLHLLWTVTFTFMAMVAIWGAIAVATWARGYWYVYGPILAGIAWFAWYVWRSGPADPPAASAAPPGEPLVR